MHMAQDNYRIYPNIHGATNAEYLASDLRAQGFKVVMSPTSSKTLDGRRIWHVQAERK
jgi:hypothetical protein